MRTPAITGLRNGKGRGFNPRRGSNGDVQPMSAILSEKLTTAELAGQLKRSPETLVRWRRQRIGPPYLRVQGRVLYDRASVEAWLASQQVKAVAA